MFHQRISDPESPKHRGITSRAVNRPATIVLLLVSVVLAFAACDDGGEEATPGTDDGTTGTQEEPGTATQDDNELRIRLVRDADNLDPAMIPGRSEHSVIENILEGLVAYEPESDEVVNRLAESLESSDDGLRHDFVLKEGIQFHGGYGELTAEDVKFSFERIAGLTEPAIESSYAGDWETLEEVEVTGDYSGTIVLSEPFAPLMTTTLPSNAGFIVSKAAVEDLGDDFSTNPIGTGPYELADYTPGQQTVLERFEDYGGTLEEYAETPQWDTITFVPIEDDSAADISVESGEVDFGFVSTSGIARFEDDSRFGTEEQTTLDYGWVGMNVTDDVLSDINVRRAIRAALDVEAMIVAGFDNRVERANALVAEGSPVGYWPDAPVYGPDLEAAQGHLDEAGVGDLSLTMTINEQAGSRAVAEIVQANLSEIGIDVQIDLVDDSEFLDAGAAGTHQLFYQSFSNSADPSWATVWFTCEQVGDWNWMAWCNEDFDELHRAAIIEQDPDVRHEHYVEMQEIMDEDVVAVWVMYRTNLFAFDTDLEPSLSPPLSQFLAWDFRR